MTFHGARGWISQSVNHQIVFLHFPAGSKATPHRHGAQWGVVLSGRMVLTFDSTSHQYGPGEWHHVPAGTMHSVDFLEDTWLIDIFDDANRYRVREERDPSTDL